MSAGGMSEAEALRLVNQAAAIDGETAAIAAAEEAGTMGADGVIVAPDPNAGALEWFLVPKTLAWAITAVFPETAPAYTDEKCMELAGAIAPVAQKYGINGIGDSPELTLVMATGMFSLPAYLAYKQRKAEREAAEAEAERVRLGGAPGGV